MDNAIGRLSSVPRRGPQILIMAREMTITASTTIRELRFYAGAPYAGDQITGPNRLWRCKTPFGDFSVLSRESAYSYDRLPLRDIESAHLAPDGKLSVRSGNFDIRQFPDVTIAAAIELIRSGNEGT